MLVIDRQGRVISPRVRLAISPHIEHGPLTHIRGIIVHQTGSANARATLNGYQHPANGAHFLIDKDGTIYQTASLFRQTYHVGKLRARCLAEHRCAPGEASQLLNMSPTQRNKHEMKKAVPDRYPSNIDSIGIELVGQAFPLTERDPDKRTYEAATSRQTASLKWLVDALKWTLHVQMAEVFRHPVVSQKNVTEAATASW